MTLYLDIGNTAMKWRWRKDDVCLQGDAVHHRDWKALASILAEPLAEARQVEVASVAGREADRELGAALTSVSKAAPRFYYSVATDAGVINAYDEPARLGVDRWLAVIEAWHRYGEGIIVDCGSALTLDGVDHRGRHLGGYIVPGLMMMERSLVSGTGSVRIANAGDIDTLDPGCSTTTGVRNGILRMTVAFITDAVVALRGGLSDTCPVLLTGGDAARVAPHLQMNVVLAPDLVLDGLERVTAN
jgi:type III pantothenate kinase